jgi:hypothetical protein
MEECVICYDKKEDVEQSCSQCKVKLCFNCWYNNCKGICPICERSSLNRPKICFACDNHFHIRDVTICSICNKYICYECDHNEYHSCENMLRNSRKVLKDTVDIFLLYYHYKVRFHSFHVLGVVEYPFGNVSVVKDLDNNQQEVLQFILDIPDKEILFRKIAKRTRMHQHTIGNIYRGIKEYYPSSNYTFEHISMFLRKLKTIKVCKCCHKDISICWRGYCVSCLKLYNVFNRWRTVCQKTQFVCRRINP